MKQKIIIAILLIALILTGKLDAVTLTQKIGSESMQTTVEANQIVKMKFTTKEGFRFKRWVIEEGTIQDVDLTSEEIRFRMPNSNVVISGEYDTGYVVTFNANGGSGEMAPLEITAGGNKNLTQNTFTRTGYQFQGWSTEQDNTVEYQDQANCAPTQNLTLYAVWEVITYTIEYNGNGNTSGSTASSSHTYGEEKELTTNGFSKTGHTFAGWSTSANGEVVYTDSQLVSNLSQNSGTITLYAKWTANTYTVKYNANGGSGSMSDSSYTYGETKALTKNTFTNTGYNFSGWALSTNGAVAYTDEQSVSNLIETANGTVNLYAIWTVNSVTVKFNSNGGSEVSNITVTYGGTYGTLPSSSKTGYTLEGWYKESGLTNKVTSTTKVTNSATHTLYAKWTANTYYVKYNANGGEGSMSNSTHTYGTASNLTTNTFTRDGYTFAGWSTTTSGSVVYVDSASISTLIADGTKDLYAVWTGNTYYVKYNANGGTGSMSNSTHTYGTASNLAANAFTKTGYTFAGWSTTTSGSVEYADSASISTLIASGTKDLYAVWTGNTYYVKYNANGGEGSMSNSTHTYGTASNLTANAFTRDGYTFVGWATSANGDVKYADKASVSTLATSGTKKLYAKWKVPWNEPLLGEGMIPVNWDSTGQYWVTADMTTWDYNYKTASTWSNSAGSSSYGLDGDGTARWANVMITTGEVSYYNSGSTGTATTVEVGDTVPSGKVIKDIGELYVWIPRFTYYEYDGDGYSWNADEDIGTARTYILWSSGIEDFDTDPSGLTSHVYATHTAFEPGGTHITGFWGAKYQGPESLPDNASNSTLVRANNAFTAGKSKNTTLGSHMMKDSEWGAIAYLTSAIGRIPYRNYSDWNTQTGVQQSTTHNIYGIFDMSSGYSTFTAAFADVGSSNYTNKLNESYTTDGSKYVDRYDSWNSTKDNARNGWDLNYNTLTNPLYSSDSSKVPIRGYNGIFAFFTGGAYTAQYRCALFGYSL